MYLVQKSKLSTIVMAFRRLPETPPPHSPQSMGLLATGRPLTWEEASEHREYVREHGVTQFINTFARCKDMAGRELLWGDEIEYGIFVLDEEAKTVKLSLRSEELLQQLIEKEVTALHRQEGCTWVPEYGKFMLEVSGPVSLLLLLTLLSFNFRHPCLPRRLLVGPSLATFPTYCVWSATCACVASASSHVSVPKRLPPL